MDCSICGYAAGGHDRACIERLLAANNEVLSRCVNRLHNQLHDVAVKRILNWFQIQKDLEITNEELAELRLLNESDEHETQPAQQEAARIATVKDYQGD